MISKLGIGISTDWRLTRFGKDLFISLEWYYIGNHLKPNRYKRVVDLWKWSAGEVLLHTAEILQCSIE